MLIDELLQGTRRFKFDSEGNQTIEDYPPTSRELKCAEMLKQLMLTKAGLGSTIQTLQQEVVDVIDKFNYYDKEYKELEELILQQTILATK